MPTTNPRIFPQTVTNNYTNQVQIFYEPPLGSLCLFSRDRKGKVFKDSNNIIWLNCGIQKIGKTQILGISTDDYTWGNFLEKLYKYWWTIGRASNTLGNADSDWANGRYLGLDPFYDRYLMVNASHLSSSAPFTQGGYYSRSTPLPYHRHAGGTTTTIGHHSHGGSTSTTGAHSHTVNNQLLSIGGWPTGNIRTIPQSNISDGQLLNLNQSGNHNHTFVTDLGGQHNHTFDTPYEGTFDYFMRLDPLYVGLSAFWCAGYYEGPLTV